MVFDGNGYALTANSEYHPCKLSCKEGFLVTIDTEINGGLILIWEVSNPLIFRRYYCGKTGKSGNPIKGRRVLPEHMKKIFRQKEFVCYEFKNLSSKQEEDLFGKVQMGVSLTPAEKMRATSGPWQDFTRLFEDDFSSVVGRKSFLLNFIDLANDS